MLIPPFWRGRGNHAPAGIRISRFRSVLKAAQAFEAYQDRLLAANLGTTAQVNAVRDVEAALAGIEPIPYEAYRALLRHRPPNGAARASQLISYQVARAGLDSWYPPATAENATSDLLHLSRAVNPRPDQAVAAFSGFGAGALTNAERDHLWNQFQVPLFEQFLGTDGRVIAVECEVHAGLHIRAEAAIVECDGGEIVVTSLTDEEAPALRVRTGLAGALETETCECGRLEPRIVNLHRLPTTKVASASA